MGERPVIYTLPNGEEEIELTTWGVDNDGVPPMPVPALPSEARSFIRGLPCYSVGLEENASAAVHHYRKAERWATPETTKQIRDQYGRIAKATKKLIAEIDALPYPMQVFNHGDLLERLKKEEIAARSAQGDFNNAEGSKGGRGSQAARDELLAEIASQLSGATQRIIAGYACELLRLCNIPAPNEDDAIKTIRRKTPQK